MSQTDTKDRHPTRKMLDDSRRNTAVLRASRSGRNNDTCWGQGLNLHQADGVIAKYRYLAFPLKQGYQIIGKGIVIVDEYNQALAIE